MPSVDVSAQRDRMQSSDGKPNGRPLTVAREAFALERLHREAPVRGVPVGVRRIKRIRRQLGLRFEQSCGSMKAHRPRGRRYAPAVRESDRSARITGVALS